MIKHYPTDYPKHKIVKSFSKSRSPRTLLFITNDKDEWFIEVIEIKTKTGEVANREGTIIAKDMPHWIKWLDGIGWKENQN